MPDSMKTADHEEAQGGNGDQGAAPPGNRQVLVMPLQTDSVLKIESRIARTRDRIAKWNAEVDIIEALWAGGPEYRTFCEAMAQAARKKIAELEAELQQF